VYRSDSSLMGWIRAQRFAALLLPTRRTAPDPETSYPPLTYWA
jgi:hypothetical protein